MNAIPTLPFPAFAGPYGHVYWIEAGANGEPFGNVMAAPMHDSGTFDPEDGIPVEDFAEPLTHGQLIDVLLGLGAVAILREREQRDALQVLCVAGEAVMESAEDHTIDIGTEAADGEIQGLGKALDTARAVLGVPDDYSTADHFNLKERA